MHLASFEIENSPESPLGIHGVAGASMVAHSRHRRDMPCIYTYTKLAILYWMLKNKAFSGIA